MMIDDNDDDLGMDESVWRSHCLHSKHIQLTARRQEGEV
jgi:hypothetical protein